MKNDEVHASGKIDILFVSISRGGKVCMHLPRAVEVTARVDFRVLQTLLDTHVLKCIVLYTRYIHDTRQ